jgi:hypothetical protein
MGSTAWGGSASSLSPHAGATVHNHIRDQRMASRASMPAQPAQPAPDTETVSTMPTVQTPVINPTKISWIWPTTAKDQNGNTVTLPLPDIVAVEVQFDGGVPIDVTSVMGSAGTAAALLLATLPAFLALPPGQHTVDIAARTAEGSVGAFTAPITFLIALVPDACTTVVLS